MNGNNVTYFDSFVVEYIPKKQLWGTKISPQLFVEYKSMIQ